MPLNFPPSFALGVSAFALAGLVVGPGEQGQAREVIGLEGRSSRVVQVAVDVRRSVMGRIAFSAGAHPHEDVYVVNADGFRSQAADRRSGRGLRSLVVARRTADRVPARERGRGLDCRDLRDEREWVAETQPDEATRAGPLPGLVAAWQKDCVCLRPRRPDAQHLGDERRRLQAEAGEPSERRVSGLVARREEDRVRPEHVRADRLGYLGDECRRLPPEAVDRITRGRARRGVVSRREDDRVRTEAHPRTTRAYGSQTPTARGSICSQDEVANARPGRSGAPTYSLPPVESSSRAETGRA